jgi:hypothetical protein
MFAAMAAKAEEEDVNGPGGGRGGELQNTSAFETTQIKVHLLMRFYYTGLRRRKRRRRLNVVSCYAHDIYLAAYLLVPRDPNEESLRC